MRTVVWVPRPGPPPTPDAPGTVGGDGPAAKVTVGGREARPAGRRAVRVDRPVGRGRLKRGGRVGVVPFVVRIERRG